MDYVEIRISAGEIKKELSQYFNSEKKNMNLVVNTIINHLTQTEMGLEALYKAMNGFEITPKFKIGEQVYVKKDCTHYWRMDEPKTREKGLMKNDMILAEITRIDLTKRKCYSISYNYYGSGSDNPIKEECNDSASNDDVLPVDVLPFEGID